MQLSAGVIDCDVREGSDCSLAHAEIVMECAVDFVKSKRVLSLCHQLLLYQLQLSAVSAIVREEFDEFKFALLHHCFVEVLPLNYRSMA
jgi:hypothetical protein